jgi:hypothetical protein
MTDKRFAVFVIRYEQKNEKDVERLVAQVTEHISTRYGEVRRVYEGSDERIISALEKVLNLTK